jgi:hypothetical protein
MKNYPLGEVFGFPPENTSPLADHFRKNHICPFNNKVPSCTKDKAKDPLGVCSIWDKDDLVITCPIRFRENWKIISDAADFFFCSNEKWTTLTEVRLTDKSGRSAGNIDVVLVSYDDNGKLIDFGAIEIQAVYISGNIREPFSLYQNNSDAYLEHGWTMSYTYPRPDYLSSSRKRLAPQLIYKGGILHSWGKKIAVIINEGFFETLPNLAETTYEEAEIVWLVYDLELNTNENKFQLIKKREIFTKFDSSLNKITYSEPSNIESFINLLQSKLDEKLDNPPDAPSLQDIFES